jgi:DNA topoisomerase-3
MVVDWELAIRKFVPKAFWRLKVSFQSEKGRYVGTWFKAAQGGEESKNRFEAGDQAQAVVGLVRSQAGRIASVEEGDAGVGPQQFYDIGAIRKEAGKRFKFSGDKTNTILQSLYLKKVMSYPRTDYRHITEGEAEKLPGILQAVKKHFPQYAPIVEEMERMGLIPKDLGKRFVDGSKTGEHSALLPTEDKPTEPLTEDEKKVFDLVVRRVLAAFYPDRVSAKTTIITEVSGETFVTRGSVLKEEGWSRIDPSSRKSSKGAPGKPEEGQEEGEGGEEDGSLPAVHQGMPVTVADAQAPQEMTKPPKRLKEGDLEDLMKSAGKFLEEEELEGLPADFGIGTGATRADIIKTLLDRKYLVKEKEYLVPMDKAFSLMEDLPDPVLRSPQMTAEWERRLGKIERNEDSREAFMKDIFGLVGRVVEAYRSRMSPESLKADHESSTATAEPLGTCPKCTKGSLIRYKRRDGTGYFAKCDRKSCAAFAGVDDAGNLVLRDAPCRFCGAHAVTSSQFGDKCMACDKTQGVPVATQCDKCNSGMIGLTFKGQHYVKCLDQNGQGCKRSWNTDPTFTTRIEVKVDIRCCKCGSEMLPKFHKDAGGNYVKCSNPECNAWWPTDANYRTPTLGQCGACRGPLHPTRASGPVCVKCGTFVNKKKES